MLPSATRPFRGLRERRISAGGTLLPARSAPPGPTCGDLLRRGAGDEELADTWRATMWGTLAGYERNEAGFTRPIRPRSAIGGGPGPRPVPAGVDQADITRGRRRMNLCAGAEE